MDLDRTPSQIANAAAEEIRALNHVTRHADTYDEPANVSATVSTIEQLVYSLPQVLRQTMDRLQEMAGDDRGIRIDSGEDSGQAVADVATALGLAREHLSAVGAALQRANRRLSTMGRPWPEGDEEG